ncbi:fungal-specific transcription factor domain-containing protein [Hypoxylon sp. FL1150]|nr:fungal-specific transcription factor domain-containing protein [Hypoxylon sp. FL1150]
MKPRKDCWTCKARRIPCDGGVPTCQKCARARRVCQGYGMRLSWPRDGDKKRAATAGPPPMALSRNQIAKLFFINTTWRDVELYHRNLRMQPLDIVQTSPKLSGHPHIAADHIDLITYFHDIAHLSLVTFNMNTSQIRDAIVRMALTSDTVQGLALYDALLAFSSLHRNGYNQQAMELKISALQFLSTSSQERSLTSAKAAQHVAASMLLGAFDILLPSASEGEWLWYTQGAMDVVQATRLENQLYERDFGHLLNWVYFHDALSRFPVHHWQHASLTREAPDSNNLKLRGVQYPPLARHRPALPPPNPSYAILNILSEACDTLLDPRDPASRSEEYQGRLRALERRVENVHTTQVWARPDSTDSGDTALAVEVWQAATRVYLARATRSPWEVPADLEALIDKAFAGPVVNCVCPHFFPLFVIACEARTDDRRMAILRLIDSTEGSLHVRSRTWLKELIQSVWVHQDLHEDTELLVNYVDVVSDLISSSTYVPSFV